MDGKLEQTFALLKKQVAELQTRIEEAEEVMRQQAFFVPSHQTIAAHQRYVEKYKLNHPVPAGRTIKEGL